MKVPLVQAQLVSISSFRGMTTTHDLLLYQSVAGERRCVGVRGGGGAGPGGGGGGGICRERSDPMKAAGSSEAAPQ